MIMAATLPTDERETAPRPQALPRNPLVRAGVRLLARLPGQHARLRASLPRHVTLRDGIALDLDPARDDDWAIWRSGQPVQRRSIAFLADAIEGHDAHLLDIGSGCGAYPVFMRKALGGASRVTAFEPDIGVAARLEANLAAAGLSAEVVPLAPIGGRLAQYMGPAPDGGFIAMRLAGGDEDRILLPALAAAHPAHWPDFLLIDTARAAGWAVDLPEAIESLDYARVYEAEGTIIFYRSEADALERIHLYEQTTGDFAGAKE